MVKNLSRLRHITYYCIPNKIVIRVERMAISLLQIDLIDLPQSPVSHFPLLLHLVLPQILPVQFRDEITK